MKYSPADVPHATLETNRTCNLRCRCCYNLDRVSIKTTEAAKAEVDELLKKRNLQVLSLLGGEPTLYPGLMDIIAYVKSKGIFCQLLTNGRKLLEKNGAAYLDSLVEAGLDRVIVHIDQGQALGGRDTEDIRGRIFSRLEDIGMHFCLSVTVYNGDRAELAAAARRYSPYKYFDGTLAVLAREITPHGTQNLRLEDTYQSLRDRLGIEPCAYVPSNLSDGDVNWLIYFFLIDRATGDCLAISPRLNQIMRRVYKLIRRREMFVLIQPPAMARVAGTLVATAEAILHPRRGLRGLEAVMRSVRGRLSFQYIAIQNPPEFDDAHQNMRICAGCLDATLRNGRLTPVCLADLMNPLPGFNTLSEAPPVWTDAIFRHIEGIS